MWLNDKIVTAAQKLIKKAYPHLGGLQDVMLGEILGFNFCTEEFIQILYTGSSHWVTISTIGCQSGCVDVFDNMTPSLTESMEMQIAALLHTDKEKITVT